MTLWYVHNHLLSRNPILIICIVFSELEGGNDSPDDSSVLWIRMVDQTMVLEAVTCDSDQHLFCDVCNEDSQFYGLPSRISFD